MAAQTQLGIPTLDDSMELATSPFQNVEDLELDFDQMENQELHSDNMMNDTAEADAFIDDMMHGDEVVEVLEDENMVEDQQTGHDLRGNDFEMDENHQDAHHPAAPQDDDILYDDDEATETVEETFHQGDVQHPAEHDALLDVPSLEPEILTPQHETLGLSKETGLEDAPEPVFAASEDPAPTEFVYDGTGEEDTFAQGEEVSANASEGRASIPEGQVEPPQENQIAQVPESEADDQNRQEHSADEVPVKAVSETAACEPGDEALVEDSAVQEALHAIRLNWGGKEFPLFPSTDGDASQSFVADASLAYEPLSKLLGECHHVIQAELERAFQDELVLDVDALGLHICEDSKYAEQISIAHVVEVYLLLKRNESDEDIAPLPCRISSRTCLRSQFDYLLDAAKQSRTFSSIMNESDPNSPATETEDNGVLDTAEEPLAEDGSLHDTAPNDTDAPAPDDVAELYGDHGAAEAPSEAQGDGDVHEAGEDHTGGLQDSEVGEATATIDDIGAVPEDLPLQHDAVKPSLPDDRLEHQDVYAEEDLFEDLADDVEQAAGQDGEQQVITEAGSASSHTVEDDSKLHEEDFNTAEPYGEGLYDEDDQATLEATVSGAEDADSEQHPAEEDVIDIFDNLDDEAPEAQTGDVTETSPAGQPVTEIVDTDDTLTHTQDFDHDIQSVNNNHDGANPDSVTMPPITPQKAVPSKRKASDEEDDDLLDFDFDTPEPKRARAS